MDEIETDIIYNEDCLVGMPVHLPDNCIDTIITDPPYGLSFMSEWDSPWKEGDVQPFQKPGIGERRIKWPRHLPSPKFGGSHNHIKQMQKLYEWHYKWSVEALRVAKPGAFFLAFSGTRTWHRLACAIEDAGWIIRDTMMWLYGSGWGKGTDISKGIDKAAGAEREVVGVDEKRARIFINQKDGGYEAPGGWKAGRREINITTPATEEAKIWDGWRSSLKPAWETILVAMKPLDGTFVENALKWGVAGLNIDGARIESKVLDSERRTSVPGAGIWGKGKTPPRNLGEERHNPKGRYPANLILDEDVGNLLDNEVGNDDRPSRFFYCAKASRSERCEYNDHETVKPLELIEYLCRLTATPSGGIILDPFMGSGTTAIAAARCGRDYIGFEREKRYYDIAMKRIGEMVPIDEDGSIMVKSDVMDF